MDAAARREGREQAMEALALANRVRWGRAALRRDVKSGRLSFLEALGDDVAGGMEVGELVRSLDRIGPVRAQAVLGAADVRAHRRCGELTVGERRRLMEALAGAWRDGLRSRSRLDRNMRPHESPHGPPPGGSPAELRRLAATSAASARARRARRVAVGRGELAFVEAIASPEEADTPVAELLAALPRIGLQSARTALRSSRIPVDRVCGDLSSAERARLLRELVSRWRQRAARARKRRGGMPAEPRDSASRARAAA